MTHEEFGKYLALVMVVKRLVLRLPEEDREAIERACQEIADAPIEDGISRENAAHLEAITPHLKNALTDIFTRGENDALPKQ